MYGQIKCDLQNGTSLSELCFDLISFPLLSLTSDDWRIMAVDLF